MSHSLQLLLAPMLNLPAAQSSSVVLAALGTFPASAIVQYVDEVLDE